ncbi:hypothetical protein HanXRQr2_Chr10g0438661 [Helianthus annuus]|uniref:Uncharacterized protein n=1 Tax=Helianthus annuus TaxID=4232 RepID=A0A9K3HXX8_HELAN|nr:hypothetical protein HanXRQr2_Chr10g0438661 [Helianthus annuus]KAJ0883609.1 hypothetical protein HanPSC8_Chr10g0423571 [Helianthus annuus]
MLNSFPPSNQTKRTLFSLPLNGSFHSSFITSYQTLPRSLAIAINHFCFRTMKKSKSFSSS